MSASLQPYFSQPATLCPPGSALVPACAPTRPPARPLPYRGPTPAGQGKQPLKRGRPSPERPAALKEEAYLGATSQGDVSSQGDLSSQGNLGSPGRQAPHQLQQQQQHPPPQQQPPPPPPLLLKLAHCLEAPELGAPLRTN